MIKESLAEFDLLHTPVGQTLDEGVRPARVKALLMMFEAGIEINKLQTPSFRSAMEAAFNTSFTSCSHMLELTPVVRDIQKKELGTELCDGDLYVGYWDCAFRFADTFAFIVKKWIAGRPQYRAVAMRMTRHSLTAAEQTGLI